MGHIKKAVYSRVIPSDGRLFGEVKIWTEKEDGPMLAWFAKGEDGCLMLEKLIRKQEELELDWYDNDLRKAFDDVTEAYFEEIPNGGGCKRSDFERDILDYGDVAAELEERLWDMERELADGAAFSPYAHGYPHAGEAENMEH